jgi:hypothetical protein
MGYIPPCNANSLPAPVDINKKLLAIPGELSEEEARVALYEYLRYNLRNTVELLTGMKLAPFQAALIQGWFAKAFSIACYGRGTGKSTLIGLFAVLYAIFTPGTRILIVSSNFRSSRRILETLDSYSKRKNGVLMRQVFAGDMSKRNDIFKWTLKNVGESTASEIVCLPLADGEGLRGQRANVLIIDEALLVSRSIIENVLMPFLAAKGQEETTKILKYREKEDELIRRGLMKEEDRKVFKSKNKMILLSSASFEGEYFHELYVKYLNKIQGIASKNDAGKKNPDDDILSHFVSQLSFKVMQELAPDIMDKSILDEVQSGTIPQSVIDREYHARFVQDSGGLFRMSKMKECTVADGQRPCIEIVGDPDAEYVLAIDPNVSGSELADYFAMSLLKIVRKKDGKRIGMLVHSYAAAAVDLKDHIDYFAYILEKFNVIYISVDSTQGDNMDFISVCNESEIFKNKKIVLDTIDADFGKEDQSRIIMQMKQSYNKTSKRIVQKQNFHSAFQNAAVDHLQACIDFKNIIFAGKAQAVDGVTAQMAEQDIGNIDKTHKLFNEYTSKESNNRFAFIERQDFLIDLTKTQCSIVQVSVSNLGTRSFDIPSAYKKSKNIMRPRKDLFSSLMLANWSLKLYVEMTELPDEEQAPPNQYILI